jgi:hypothetical protein
MIRYNTISKEFEECEIIEKKDGSNKIIPKTLKWYEKIDWLNVMVWSFVVIVCLLFWSLVTLFLLDKFGFPT